MSFEKSRPAGRRILGVATAGVWALLLGAGAVWLLVSTDLWPLSDREEPATTVWAFNAALGDWFLEHGEAEPRPSPPPPRESLTATESAEVAAQLARLPTKERLPVLGRMSGLQQKNSSRQAAAPSIDVSVGGGGGRGGGGGGGACGGGSRRG